MYKIGTNYTFEAEHKLPFEGGDESKRHGHDYKLEVIVSGSHLDEMGFLVDIVKLKEVVSEIISRYEGNYLNDMEEMHGKVPSLENLAYLIWESALPGIESLGVSLEEIRLWEDEFSWTSYAGGID